MPTQVPQSSSWQTTEQKQPAVECPLGRVEQGPRVFMPMSGKLHWMVLLHGAQKNPGSVPHRVGRRGAVTLQATNT